MNKNDIKETNELLTEILAVLKERVIVFVPPEAGISMEQGKTTSKDLSDIPDQEVEVSYTTQTKDGYGKIENLVPEGADIVYDEE
tara:strand:- start:319 stop:573 length:255 start_codon:yes stop_codon:yes gene_type:complete